jgi:branched-chain amino acid transport system ATP-binding protein
MLEVRDIRASYGIAEVLKGVSIKVESGTICVVLGANGAGKTTLLRTISGLIKPSSGEIWFEGKRIDKLSPYKIVRLGISHVPEGKRLFRGMTVEDNLKLGAYLRKDKEEVAKDIDWVNELFPILCQRRTLMAGSLSGGEQQMLAIARGLMTKPKLFLMDEPSLGLSPILVQRIGTTITNIREIGISVVLVEQNAYMALNLSERAYVLQIGSIALQGESKKLSSDPALIEAYLSLRPA